MSTDDKVNILLVDDQPARLLTYETILSPLNQNLVQSQSGEDALRRLMDAEFAAILLDVSMPGMDGFETAALIHQHPRFENTPIIFVTGVHVTDIDRLKGYQLGAVDYVYVPVIPEILRGKVQVLVELYLQRRELKWLNQVLAKANEALAWANQELQAESRRELQRLNQTLEHANSELARSNQALKDEIAERKRAQDEVLALNTTLEQRVTQRTRELERANKELESFSYSVSHDLRAPLRAIAGFSEILATRHRPSLNEEGRHYMDNVVEASSHMERLIDDLLKYSRLGRNAVAIAPVSLEEAFQDVLDNHAPRIAETGARITGPDAWPLVQGNFTLLRQILANLLENALIFHRPGECPKVSLHCKTHDGMVVFSVSDCGIGIASEYCDKIFNAFQRLHSQEEYPGTGIGLAIVKRAVSLMEGEVWVESVPGQGSTFHVQLPGVVQKH